MKFFRTALATWHRQRAALAYAKRFESESRAHVARLSQDGKAGVALRESASLMGVNMSSADRPHLVALKGVRLT